MNQQQDMISEEWLDEMWEAAKRDDLFTKIVPSDVRILIKAIRELKKQVNASFPPRKPVVLPRRPRPSPGPPRRK